MKKFDQNSRYDFSIIENWTHQNSKVLDLGCGDGALLNYLKEKKNIKGFGIEKNKENWLLSLKNNIDVIQMDLESGLAGFETNSFDLVILSRTIQSMRNVEDIIHEMMRVGKEIIITFPNFGYWKNRLQILQGYMPVSEELPYTWFDTPNIHLCTIQDFDNFCKKNKIKIDQRLILTDKKSVNFYPNFFGALALYKLVSK
ncbi:MAG: methionine biosynthesis protein MetW [Nitrosomonadales bacterium]|jgi:methionine biosynthesis protein MetW|nr:methionine biosynthesis protein MetW [Nitrosomonadales bacterium]MBT3917933.1 methionine biosynthesis protein MetW [Nitrosomonadales bacterium]MBT4183111.1 methionine biosynthesis protein MetW [Nitrosomonadales bacterium]MBT4571646.1 methionine biosynthesis protein MetW [Nitrosomonadales bacterium]MBT6014479.1 methionine biosynthesis protein MetW [Nitrosomonadales bacterium]